MLPKDKQPPGKRYSTMNARAETVGQLPTYRQAWSRAQLCLVPMRSFYEPSYESGKSIRWRIRLNDERPFAVAGLWRAWDEGTADERYSFTQLTINADAHPFISRFHPVDDEKRSLVVITPDAYDEWLNCRNPEFARAFLQLYPADLMQGEPSPVPSRQKSESTQVSLF
ncbi:MAG: SOS response-associated peptidase family protein [Rhodocyclaceae bacterium]|nr:SOS response-associated peptidase family protein [Rhodocyclaceae bacterium]